MTRWPLPLVVALALLGCGSPEASRTRGGGAGGDVGNRREVVRMHEGSRPYYRTPDRIGEFGGGDLESARHAHRLSGSR
jgi:hypothetical protein